MTARIDPRFGDVSSLRQLPDTQEVFADPTTDQSIIIEILETQTIGAADTPAHFHFHVLADDNGAAEAAVEGGTDEVPVAFAIPGCACWEKKKRSGKEGYRERKKEEATSISIST